MSSEELKDFIETASSVSPFRVEDDFGGGYVRLRSEEAERRQAIHDIRSSEDVVIEALRNARDAHARTIFLATSKEGDTRRITMIDDGDGVPAYMHHHIFEPRVTSKLDSAHLDKWGVHGRGMALYSISVNCEAAYVVTSDRGLGASFRFEADTKSLGERSDQSTFPAFELMESGTVRVRGPRNILRTACEFAVDSAASCTVYLGTAAEIAATLYAFGLATLPPSMRAFYEYPEQLPVCKRLGLAADPDSFIQLSEGIGLELSQRTARRILDGDIAPVEPLIDRISIVGISDSGSKAKTRAHRSKSNQDSRGLQLHPDDADALKHGIKDAYAPIARDYFLDPTVEPEVAVRKDRITVTIPIKKL